VKLVAWDLGLPERYQKLFSYYFQDAQAIIFVIDSNDRDRIDDAAEELNKLLKEEQLKNAVLLVLANKKDQIGMSL
jgi:GTPase SAR1 family protein